MQQNLCRWEGEATLVEVTTLRLADAAAVKGEESRTDASMQGLPWGKKIGDEHLEPSICSGKRRQQIPM